MVTYSQREPQGSQRERGGSHAGLNRRPPLERDRLKLIIPKQKTVKKKGVCKIKKIKKLTGLDLREFDDAITFKVAIMVKKYLVSRGIEG